MLARELVARELAVVRAGANARERRERIEFLLEEAFLGDTPAQDFATATSSPQAPDDPFSDPVPTAGVGVADNTYLDRQLANLPRLREHHEPAPYWPARHGRQRADSSQSTAARRFAALIGDLRVVDEGRTDLLERALRSPDRGVAERVARAVAHFRARAATEHDKRSAVLTLVGILEELGS